MPITPLHVGVLAPINFNAPGKVSAVSFVVTQLILDAATIRFFLTGHGGVDHSNHTLHTALLLAAAVGLVGFWSVRWVCGAFVGTFSHVFLDALVHTDVYPMAPWVEGNPLYLSAMQPLSLILLTLSAWWLLQITSAIFKWVALRAVPVVEPALQIPDRAKTSFFRALTSSLSKKSCWDWGRGLCLIGILALPHLPF